MFAPGVEFVPRWSSNNAFFLYEGRVKGDGTIREEEEK